MNNAEFKSIPNDVAYERGYVYSLEYHIVWCTKYRRPILVGSVADDLKAIIKTICGDMEADIEAMEIMPDHIHLLLSCKPKLSISDILKRIKGTGAKWLFGKHPELKQYLYGGHLWNPSYFVATVSDRSREQIEKYIGEQKSEGRSKWR